MRVVKSEEIKYVSGGGTSNPLAIKANTGLGDIWQLPEEITPETMTEWLHNAFTRIADILNNIRIR